MSRRSAGRRGDDGTRFQILGLYRRRNAASTLGCLDRVAAQMPCPVHRPPGGRSVSNGAEAIGPRRAIPTDRGGEFFADEVQQRLREGTTCAGLLAAGMAPVEAARVVAQRFSVSARQGRRYVDAAQAGPMEVPEANVVFTVKLPASLAARVRDHAHEQGVTISAAVTPSERISLWALSYVP